MTTKLLAVLTNRLFVAGLLCCLWVATDANTASAQALTNPICTTKIVKAPAPQPDYWQNSGTVSATNIPANTMTVSTTFQFERRAKGAFNWTVMYSVGLQTTPVNGVANFDTGFTTFTPAPGAGEEFRVYISGYYVNGMGMRTNIPPAESPIRTPIP